MGERFRLQVADPPWPAKDALPGKKRGAARNYKTMSIADICAFPQPPMADLSVLLLWRVGWMVPEACEVAKAWGFRPMSEIVWLKTTASGKPRMLMGRHVRYQHEVTGRSTTSVGSCRGSSACYRVPKRIRKGGCHGNDPNDG